MLPALAAHDNLDLRVIGGHVDSREAERSRSGGSLWQFPMRFVENSPIFMADRVATPLLMLHNDQDGAAPWYQGIERLSEKGSDPLVFAAFSIQSGEFAPSWARGLTPFRIASHSFDRLYLIPV